MCYASPVMLRGRCSCAISDRPTPSLFATLSLFRPLSLIIPVHPRTAPVSPIIPVHTQNRGGGVGYRNGNVPKICRRADILECGGSPPLLGLTHWRYMNSLSEMDGIAKAGASSRTPKTAKAHGAHTSFGGMAGEKGQPTRPARQERQMLFGFAAAGVAVALVLAPAAAAAARAGTFFSASFALRSISIVPLK